MLFLFLKELKFNFFKNESDSQNILIPFCINVTIAQQNLTIEKLWQLGRVSDMQVLPDGKTVIFGVSNYDVKSSKCNNIIYIKSPHENCSLQIMLRRFKFIWCAICTRWNKDKFIK